MGFIFQRIKIQTQHAYLNPTMVSKTLSILFTSKYCMLFIYDFFCNFFFLVLAADNGKYARRKRKNIFYELRNRKVKTTGSET